MPLTQKQRRLVKRGEQRAKRRSRMQAARLAVKRSPGRLHAAADGRRKYGSVRFRADVLHTSKSTVARWGRAASESGSSGSQSDDSESSEPLLNNGAQGGHNRRIHPQMFPLMAAFVEARFEKDVHTSLADLGRAVVTFERLLPELQTAAYQRRLRAVRARHATRRNRQGKTAQSTNQTNSDPDASDTDEELIPSKSVLSRLATACGISHQAAQQRKSSRRRETLEAEIEHFLMVANFWPKRKLCVADETNQQHSRGPGSTLAPTGKLKRKKSVHIAGENRGQSSTCVHCTRADPTYASVAC